MVLTKQSNYLRLIDNLEYLKLKQFKLHLDEIIDEESKIL